MVTKKNKAPKFDFSKLQGTLQGQFQNFDIKEDPSLWPVAPRVLLCLAIIAVVAFLAWYFMVSDLDDVLAAEQKKEQTLRDDYQKKLVKAVNLDELKKQRQQIQQYVAQLEKQLPSKAEMSALLSDINQAGLGRSLKFELFRPSPLVAQDYYAELPISIRVTGKFHDMGAFVADVAGLSRIVTLNNLAIAPATQKDAGTGDLVMDATARTFRYLDPEEIQAQKAALKEKKK